MPGEEKTITQILKGMGKHKPDPEPEMAEEVEAPQDVGPCGWVWVKGCRALDVERGGSHPVVALQYVYLGVISEFQPTKFWIDFVGEKTWRMTVEGRNLRPLFDRISDHCLRRIRQVNRDMLPDDGKPAVARITVEEVKEKG